MLSLSRLEINTISVDDGDRNRFAGETTMPRIAALKPAEVPTDSKLTLDAFTKNLGFTPNMMATFCGQPDRVQRVGYPAHLLEQGARPEDA